MVSDTEPNTGLRYTRRQAMDMNLATPEWKDEKFPTAAITISGLGHGTSSPSAGSAWLLGSRRIAGSPNDITYQMTYANFNLSTPAWFALTHSRGSPRGFGGNFPGTVKLWSMKSGPYESVGRIDQPLKSIPPGTVRLYVLGPLGTSGAVHFTGWGSSAKYVAAAEVTFYPV